MLIGQCPVIKVVMAGIVVPCLVNTGSMESTITEEFFFRAFSTSGLGYFAVMWLATVERCK